MGTAYVLAPNSGQNWGQNCYCSKKITCTDLVERNCLNNLSGTCVPICGTGCTCNDPDNKCPHQGVGGWESPIDISGSPSQAINFYPTSGILSIRTTRSQCVCGGTGTWSYCVSVSLYSNLAGTTLIGRVLYAHLDNTTRIADGYYQQNLWGRKIGQMTATNCGCNCYSGIHVHLQRSQGSTPWLYGCQSQMYSGSTKVYGFTY